MNLLNLIIIAFAILIISEMRESSNNKSSKKRTLLTTTELFSALSKKGIPKSSQFIIAAHAAAESFINNKFSSYGFNFWNFGKPSWWENVWHKAYSLVKRNDDVRNTIGFSNISDAIDGYLLILQRGRPSAYSEIQKESPDIDAFLASLCPSHYGQTGNSYASACNSNYAENINSWYSYYITNYWSSIIMNS